ncbi:tax1-binding protein 1-like A, partial [Silurus meridionalis]
SHVRSAELENTKLSAELQMLKAVELNREVTISQYQEEIHRLQAERTAHVADANVIEQLRQVKEQLEATYQRAAMLDSELRDATRDHERTKETAGSVSELEAELQKEVEELKLRLQMAAEHYKEKYRECQRLRRQVTKLTHKQESQQEDCSKNEASTDARPETEADAETEAESPVAETLPEIQECAETQEREDGEGEKTETGKEEQQDEGDESKLAHGRHPDEDEAQLAEKDGEVFLLRENLAEVMREKVKLEETVLSVPRYNPVSEVYRQFLGLHGLVCALTLTGNCGTFYRQDLRLRASREDAVCGQRSEVREPVVLRYPLPYPTESPPLALVPQQPAELQYGNPYSEPEQRDGADGALSPPQSCRPPPVTPPPWVGPVVCSQPLRSLSPPDGLENPAEERPSGGDGEAPAVCEHQSPESNESGSSFCFDTRSDVHKRCPLCEVIFPPHFEQRSFERHVESHWRECPVCSEQFPLDCQQNLFEKHVLTHFDGNVLNFHNFD